MEPSQLYSKQKLLLMMDQNNDEVKQLMDIFVRAVPEMLNEMQTYSQCENWYECGNIAHKLKSSARLWDITSVDKDLVYIEEQGIRAKDTSQVNQKVKAVNKILRLVVADMASKISIS